MPRTSLGARCREFESPHSDHVGAKSALLRRLFMPAAKKPSSARSLAPPFQLRPAVLGSQLVCRPRAACSSIKKYRF